MPDIREYVAPNGVSPFGRWFDALDPIAAAKISIALARLGEGNTSNLKSIGAGVFELRVHFGPGYRIYAGLQGATIVVLLGGGDKCTQSEDIRKAQRRWKSFKAMTRRGGE